jgi:dephospho-CoA kinase
MQTKRPTIIALTGGLAAGKSSAADIFRSFGAAVIDTDLIARSLLSPSNETFHRVIEHFGTSILTPQGEVDRRQLRRIVFEHPEEKIFLETLLHPKIQEAVREQRDALLNEPSLPPYLLIVVPLLHDKTSYPADVIVTIEASFPLQISRVVERDQISESLAKRMIESQPSTETREALADFVVWNTGKKEDLVNALKYIRLRIDQAEEMP